MTTENTKTITFDENLLGRAIDGLVIEGNTASFLIDEVVQYSSPQTQTDFYRLPGGQCLKHQLWDYQQVPTDKNNYICLDPRPFDEIFASLKASL